jgi:uncharacterized protein
MFVYGQPALFIEDYLVISDLHLGISREIYLAGISLPSQIDRLSERLNELKKQTKTKKLIITGDFKHNIPNISYLERKEVPELLTKLKFKEIIIVKGNHDGMIENLVTGIKNVKVKPHFTVGDYYFTHGHRKAKTTKKNIVIGHNHPGIKFRDRFGAIYVEPCWVLGKVKLEKNGKTTPKEKNLIIIPAFNELSGKQPVNDSEFMGPIAKRIKEPRAILLDGTDLGEIKDLK